LAPEVSGQVFAVAQFIFCRSAFAFKKCLSIRVSNSSFFSCAWGHTIMHLKRCVNNKRLWNCKPRHVPLQ